MPKASICHSATALTVAEALVSGILLVGLWISRMQIIYMSIQVVVRLEIIFLVIMYSWVTVGPKCSVWIPYKFLQSKSFLRTDP